jgi:hypothetical protein
LLFEGIIPEGVYRAGTGIVVGIDFTGLKKLCKGRRATSADLME